MNTRNLSTRRPSEATQSNSKKARTSPDTLPDAPETPDTKNAAALVTNEDDMPTSNPVAQPSVVTPSTCVARAAKPASPPPVGPYCTVMILETGKVLTFTDQRRCRIYKEENSDSIQDTIDFLTKEDHDNYKKQDATPVSHAKVTDEQFSELEKQALARIKKQISTFTPTSHFLIRYKTTSFSRAVLFLFEPRNAQSDKLWHWKPVDIVPTIKAVIGDSITTVSNGMTRYIFENMDHADKRDLEKSESSVLKSKAGYNETIIYSHFKLPLANGATWTRKEEQELINQVLTTFAQEAKRIMASAIFCEAYKSTVGKYSEKMAPAIFTPKKGASFPKFIQGCDADIAPLNQFTDVSSSPTHLSTITASI